MLPRVCSQVIKYLAAVRLILALVRKNVRSEHAPVRAYPPERHDILLEESH